MNAHKVPSPFVRYRCSQCNRWIREEAVSCVCGAVFFIDIPSLHLHDLLASLDMRDYHGLS